eukprot:scaffold72655_cov36-Cyclotella_meneghiniana.AAC.3
MYDEKRSPDFALPPYQHEDHGGPVSILAGCYCTIIASMCELYNLDEHDDVPCVYFVECSPIQSTSNTLIPPHPINITIKLIKDGLGRAANPVKFLQSIEQRARERQVAYETVRLLRQDVIHCYRKEGVNHYENCKDVVEKYARVVLKRDVGQVNPTFSDEGKNYGY